LELNKFPETSNGSFSQTKEIRLLLKAPLC